MKKHLETSLDDKFGFWKRILAKNDENQRRTQTFSIFFTKMLFNIAVESAPAAIWSAAAS